jgi:hypothetical protein
MPREVEAPPESGKYWSRRGIAEWLAAQIQTNGWTLIGIGHGFLFPPAYAGHTAWS